MLEAAVTDSGSNSQSNSSAWPFFAVAFAITGLTQLPAVLAMRGIIAAPFASLIPFVAIGAISPMLAALIISRFEPGAAGWRSVFRPLRKWRANPAWYVLALCLPGAILMIAMAALQLVSDHNVGPWIYPPRTAQAITGMIVVSLGEEIGWRGFALPRLQKRYGPLMASLMLGVLWAIWHVPVLLLAGIHSLTTLLLMIPFFTAGSLVFTWIYNKTQAGLLLAILAHMGAHLNNSHQSLPGNVTPFTAHTIAFLMLALALVLGDRKSWQVTRTV
jgi:membrane protease YdiL (CAAX protease family)